MVAIAILHEFCMHTRATHPAHTLLDIKYRRLGLKKQQDKASNLPEDGALSHSWFTDKNYSVKCKNGWCCYRMTVFHWCSKAKYMCRQINFLGSQNWNVWFSTFSIILTLRNKVLCWYCHNIEDESKPLTSFSISVKARLTILLNSSNKPGTELQKL